MTQRELSVLENCQDAMVTFKMHLDGFNLPEDLMHEYREIYCTISELLQPFQI